MTKSLYRFYAGSARGKYITQTGHISPYNLHKTYITNNILATQSRAVLRISH